MRNIINIHIYHKKHISALLRSKIYILYNSSAREARGHAIQGVRVLVRIYVSYLHIIQFICLKARKHAIQGVQLPQEMICVYPSHDQTYHEIWISSLSISLIPREIISLRVRLIWTDKHLVDV